MILLITCTRLIFLDGNQHQSGINTYAVIAPPRASGTETIIISANWLSLSFSEQVDPISAGLHVRETEGHVRIASNTSRRNPNLRGIAEVLTFAAFLRGMYKCDRFTPPVLCFSLIALRTLALTFRAAHSHIGQNHWAKEFVIVFGDGYADGLEAFLAAYHGTRKSGKSSCVGLCLGSNRRSACFIPSVSPDFYGC